MSNHSHPINPSMKEFWDQRYKEDVWAYGTEPNSYFKEKLKDLAPGKILLPADGEGRNCVYAATQGWKAFAFDQSAEGRNKAQKLAELKGVQIDFRVSTFEDVEYSKNEFDAAALIYVHLPPNLRKEYHRKISSYLKPGGTIILEAFSKTHIQFNSVNPKAGGPKDVNLLFSVEEM